MSYQYQENLALDAQQRYSVKLKLIGLDICPYKVPADTWINDPKQWPAFEYQDVFHYLIKHPRTHLFVSGWVQTVFHMKTDSGHYVLKADVKPSWRVTEEPHHPWVALKKSGPVIAAHCNCMAGLGETCFHIGALLFKIEAAVQLGYTSSTCTDRPCEWNGCFVKNVEPKKIADIIFYKTAAKEKLKNSKRKMRKMIEPATTEEQKRFLQSLAVLKKKPCVGLSAFKEYSGLFVSHGPGPTSTKLPPSFRSFYSANNESIEGVDLTKMSNSMYEQSHISDAQVAYVEEVTRNQSSSLVWHEQRVGRITASIAGDCLRTRLSNPSPYLIKKICVANEGPKRFPADPDHVPCGNVYMTIPTEHLEGTVQKSGLFICKDSQFLGASPDGQVQCKCCGAGVLEIKCPYKYREARLVDALSDTGFYLDKDYHLKKTHKYFAQVQMQMHVCNKGFTDLVVWTPLDVIIVRVNRDIDFIHDMVKSLQMFWEKHILPELITRRFERNVQSECSYKADKENMLSDNTKSYCVCENRTKLDDMVGCDHCDTWFHIKCIGLKSLPTSKTWYCKECKKLAK
ncbi:hypothetical protein ACJMK2_043178 [Sinanodonta woodiana]|uniref:PHD-type domain-containing protein n=1 Tax=Sinanodonta woodiana TaxID=1069815 RepID=A0ABD3VZA1_SINWO